MTLIMMAISSNGIVAAADTRRTIRTPNKDISYLDTTIKVLKFKNFVMNYAGSSMIDGVLVGDWLIEKIGNKTFHTPFDVFHFILKRLPEGLVNGDSNKSITFFCGMYVDNSPMIVEMTTFNKNIKIQRTVIGSGAIVAGSGANLAVDIFNCDLEIQLSQFDSSDVVDLFEIVGRTVIDIAKFSKNQTIGGKILTEILQRPNPDLLK